MNRKDIVKMGRLYQSVVDGVPISEEAAKVSEEVCPDCGADSTKAEWEKAEGCPSCGAKAADIGEDTTDGVAPGSLENDGHLCASRIFAPGLGEGTTVAGEHAEPDANGSISWYNVKFDNGIAGSVEMTEEVVVLEEGMHGNHKKKKMKKEEVEQVDEISQGMKNRYVKRAAMSAAGNAHSDGIALAHGNQPDVQKKHKDKVMKRLKGINLATRESIQASVDGINELSKSTLGSYTKKAAKRVRAATSLSKSFDADAHLNTKTANKHSPNISGGNNDGPKDPEKLKNANKAYKVNKGLANDFKRKAQNGVTGIGRAADRLAKEEVEQVDEIKIPSNYGAMVAKAKKKKFMDSQKAAKAAAAPAAAPVTKEDVEQDVVEAIMAEGVKKHHSIASAYKSMWEETDRAKHYKGATKPQEVNDNLPKSQTDFIASLHKTADIEDETKEVEQDQKKTEKIVRKQSPQRGNEPRGNDPIHVPTDTTKLGKG